jgi:hypothetical protein
MDILTLFFDIDEFCQRFEPIWKQHLLADGSRRRTRERSLALSEVMTILVLFHCYGYRNLKQFYLEFVCRHLQSEFPDLVGYSRFVQFEQEALVPLAAYLQSKRGICSGVSFVDSTKLIACQNLRIRQHKQFADLAPRGKTSTGWFFGFKLHLTVNDRGELLSWLVTPGNIDDRRAVPPLAKGFWGKLFGDRGYISNPLKRVLREQDLELVMRAKKNQKNVAPLPAEDKILLRKRAIIETIIDQLKNTCRSNIRDIDHFGTFWSIC